MRVIVLPVFWNMGSAIGSIVQEEEDDLLQVNLNGEQGGVPAGGIPSIGVGKVWRLKHQHWEDGKHSLAQVSKDDMIEIRACWKDAVDGEDEEEETSDHIDTCYYSEWTTISPSVPDLDGKVNILCPRQKVVKDECVTFTLNKRQCKVLGTEDHKLVEISADAVPSSLLEKDIAIVNVDSVTLENANDAADSILQHLATHVDGDHRVAVLLQGSGKAFVHEVMHGHAMAEGRVIRSDLIKLGIVSFKLWLEHGWQMTMFRGWLSGNWWR